MPNKLSCGNHFAVYIIYQVIMFYGLNWYNLLCQLHLNKTGKIKWVSCKQQKKLKKVIYIIASIDSSVFFKSLSSISLYGFLRVGVFIYLLKNILIASSFGNYDQWFINILYTFPCGHKFFHQLRERSGTRCCVSTVKNLLSFFRKCQTLFQSGCTTLYSYLMNKNSWWMRITDASYACQQSILSMFWILDILIDM